jgi:hypothetical protein
VPKSTRQLFIEKAPIRREAEVKNMAQAAQLTAVERPAKIPTGFMEKGQYGKPPHLVNKMKQLFALSAENNR